RYAGSTSCAPCHPDQNARWRRSHHASAERPLSPELDGPAFTRARDRFEAHDAETGSFLYRGHSRDGRAVLQPVRRALAHDPLRQYLVDAGGGRLQVTQQAFDPARKEWFDVFGGEQRQPGEWGHESGRAMTWNSRCANCHDTGVRVGYDPESDRFDTRVREFGVGCEACHGPAADHVRARTEGLDEGREQRVRLNAVAGSAGIDVCLSCHSRRSELDEDFRPGDAYLDHFLPRIPDRTDLYHPDGQVRDENFVGVSFRMSRMYAEGVRCGDCHDAHSGDLLRTGDALCLDCHAERPGFQLHGHHPEESSGARCVGCHMPSTTYMQRDPRRDHSFPIPNPQLSESLGVPNACTGCHADRSPAWASEQLQAWFGEPDAARSELTEAIAALRRGDPAPPGLLAQTVAHDPRPGWRAVAAGLLGSQPSTLGLEAAEQASEDPDAWVRSAAARALGEFAQAGFPQARHRLRSLLRDPVRAVRVEAARALRGDYDPEAPEVADLAQQITLHLDQPTARAELGTWLLERGRIPEAIPELERAVAWDPGSPGFYQALAIAQIRAGKVNASLATLEMAVDRLPEAPGLQFDLALVYAEMGRRKDALRALERSVVLAPGFSRAWYNLGLARRDDGDPEGALQALTRAESLEPGSSRAPYARALVLRDLGRLDAARQAALRARAANPASPAARALMEALEPGGDRPWTHPGP
ncbi:MAG: tetratricopeptide repeat protein, partial [Myxococcota bacterium]